MLAGLRVQDKIRELEANDAKQSNSIANLNVAVDVLVKATAAQESIPNRVQELEKQIKKCTKLLLACQQKTCSSSSLKL